MQQSVSHIFHPPYNALMPWWYILPLYAIILGGILFLHHSVSPLLFVAGMILFFLTVYFPEIPLVAFVFIGVTKPWIDENVAIFQTIDYTVFLALYICLLIFVTLVRRQTYLLPSFSHFLPLLFIFSVMLFIGIIYSSAPSYGFEKATRFFLFNILLFLATIVIVKEIKDIVRILGIIVGLSFIFAGIMFYEGIQSLLGGDVIGVIVRMTILGANPISSARIFSLAFLIVLIAAYYASRRSNQIILYSLSAYFLVALIVTNTRGPLLSTIAAVFVFALLLSNMKYKTLAIYFGLFIAAIVSALLFLPDFVTSRYEALVAAGAAQQTIYGGEVDTVGSRLMMWSMAFSGAFESVWNFLFGHGTGSFASLFLFSDIRWYPHNIFAEVIYELGIIGLVIIVLHLGQITGYSSLIWEKTSQGGDLRLIAAIILVITIGSFMASLVSGDLTDNRYLWFQFGLIVAFWRVIDNRSKANTY